MTRYRRLMLAVVALAAFTVLAGCDVPPLTEAEIGNGLYSLYNTTATQIVLPGPARPAGETCWSKDPPPGMDRRALGQGKNTDLYQVSLAFIWCTNGGLVTAVLQVTCMSDLKDSFVFGLAGSGGIREGDPCTNTPAGGIPLGHNLVHIDANWHFWYSIAHWPLFENRHDFRPQMHLNLHAPDGTHGTSAYFEGWGANG